MEKSGKFNKRQSRCDIKGILYGKNLEFFLSLGSHKGSIKIEEKDETYMISEKYQDTTTFNSSGFRQEFVHTIFK